MLRGRVGAPEWLEAYADALVNTIKTNAGRPYSRRVMSNYLSTAYNQASMLPQVMASRSPNVTAPFEYAPLMTMFPVPGAEDSGEPSFKRGRPITRMLRISRATAAANVAAISTSAETLPPLRRTRRGRGGLSCNVSMAGLRPRNALPGNGAPRLAAASARPEKRKRAADAQPAPQKETKRLKKKKEKKVKKDRKRAADAAADEGDAAPSKKKKKKKKKST